MHAHKSKFLDDKPRASDRVRKKITNYAEIFRNIMRKKVLIMRKTRWIMRKIFGSLRSPKITSIHAAEIDLPPKLRVCSQANFKQKKLYWYLGFSSYLYLYLVCYEIILSIYWSSMKITQPLICWLKLIFLWINNTIQGATWSTTTLYVEQNNNHYLHRKLQDTGSLNPLLILDFQQSPSSSLWHVAHRPLCGLKLASHNSSFI